MRRLTMRACWRARFIASAAILITTSAAWLGTPEKKTAMIPELIRAGKLTAQLNDVPSHNRRYRATLIPSPDNSWRLRIENSDGEAVSGASLVIWAWMPESSSVSGYQPRAITDGKGAYRVEGLYFDRSGWWNVKLGVSASGMADSLAFNLIIP